MRFPPLDRPDDIRHFPQLVATPASRGSTESVLLLIQTGAMARVLDCSMVLQRPRRITLMQPVAMKAEAGRPTG
jgi:hypothetical protein